MRHSPPYLTPILFILLCILPACNKPAYPYSAAQTLTINSHQKTVFEVLGTDQGPFKRTGGLVSNAGIPYTITYTHIDGTKLKKRYTAETNIYYIAEIFENTNGHSRVVVYKMHKSSGTSEQK